MIDTLEDSLGVEGIGGTALLIWLAFGVLGLILEPFNTANEAASSAYP